MIDLKNVSGTEALRYAKDKSGLSAKEIAESSGISVAMLNRYLNQNDNYSPSMEMIPELCRILGNDVLLQWLNIRCEREAPRQVPPAKTRADVLTSVAWAGAALGDVQRLLADHAWLTPEDARMLRTAMSEVVAILEDARLSLQPLAETQDREPRFLMSRTPLSEPPQEDKRVTAENVGPTEPWWKFWRKK